MTYLLVKKTSFGNFANNYFIVKSSDDLAKIKKFHEAYKVLAEKNESFEICQFGGFEEPKSVAHDENFDFNQLNLPFPEVKV